MIIVTGTKRSGTSMWMQLLRAGGVPVLGDAFSRDWKETIEDANPHGFFESDLRRGVYYRTNPHPKTGHYLRPEDTALLSVKVFIPGLCRTDISYVDKVVCTMRDWREYPSSLRRLLEMEKTNREAKTGKPKRQRPRLEPLLEWWLENYTLIRDVATRGYPIRVVSYDRVVREPETWIPRMFDFVGTGDPALAIERVDPTVRTQSAEALSEPDVPHDCKAAFDAMYAVAHDGQPITPALIEEFNRVHEILSEPIEAALKEVRFAATKRRLARLVKGRDKKRSALSPDAIEFLVHDGEEA